MKKTTMLLVGLITLMISVTLVASQPKLPIQSRLTTVKALPRITKVHRVAFKNMVKNYFVPVIHGWGIGFDCSKDNYVRVKFHVVNVRTIPRDKIKQIITDAKEEGVEDWSVVRERIKEAIDAEGSVVKKGRMRIENEKYLLTDIEVGDSLSADIRVIPNYTLCKENDMSLEECENNAEKVGHVEITKRTGTELPGDPRFWDGTLSFKDTDYRFVTLAYPRR